MRVENHGGIILTEETEELSEKSVPVSLCSSEIPYGLTRARIQAFDLRGWRLTA
jgi:hypothetical protein